MREGKRGERERGNGGLGVMTVGLKTQALFEVFDAESLAGLQVQVASGTLEAEEAVRNVLHHIQSHWLANGLQSSGHVH